MKTICLVPPTQLPFISALGVKDYNHALHIHNHVAQTANFSEVGSFLPGIKVLLQVRTVPYSIASFTRLSPFPLFLCHLYFAFGDY